MAPVSLPPSLFNAPDVDFSASQPLEVWLRKGLESAQSLEAKAGHAAAGAADTRELPAGSGEGPGGSGATEGKAQMVVADARATAADVGPSADSSRGLSCSLCGVPHFVSVSEQRRHFKSDWHRYNVKRQLRGRGSVSEEGFAGSLQAHQSRGTGPRDQSAEGDPDPDARSDVSSISASDASSQGEEEGDSDGESDREGVASGGIKRQLGSTGGTSLASAGTGRERGRNGAGPGQVPKEWFTVASVEGHCFGVWRSLVEHHAGPPSDEELQTAPVEKTTKHQAGRVLQWIAKANTASSRAPRTADRSRRAVEGTVPPSPAISEAGGILWAVILSMGGHFAGVVVDAAQQARVLHHKTFHRYVVRAKAGGRQSTKDGTGRAAHSAGSSLRRYNEAALTKDIGNLLWEWRGLLASAALIVVHAPSANEAAVFDTARGPGAPREHHSPLQRGDPRVCSPPFTVRRPTYKEACRVAQRLAELEWLPLEGLRRTAGAAARAAPAADAASATRAGEATNEAEAGPLLPVPEGVLGEEHRGLQGANGAGVGAGHTEGARGALEGLSLGKAEDLTTQSGAGVVDLELHAASVSGDAARVAELLAQGRDPTVRDERGRTAYAVAASKEVRDAFRRHMGAAPAQWDWHAAGVPSALTEELEAAQAAKRAEKEQKRKAKEKERKKAARMAKQQKEQKEKQEQELLQEQQRQQALQEAARIEGEKEAKVRERELRAAAAERRLGQAGQQPPLQGSQVALTSGGSSSSAYPACDTCQRSLANLVPFYRLAFKYCSTTCLRAHKAVLDSP